MQIDYGSNGWDAPYQFAFRHGMYVAGDILCRLQLGANLLETADLIRHIALCILELIPGAGYLVAYFDQKLNERKVRIIRLTEDTPFKRGEELGKVWREDLQLAERTVVKIYQALLGGDPNDIRDVLQPYVKKIPQEYQDEMQGISQAAKVSLETILLGNIAIDKLIGCTVYGLHQEDGRQLAEVATNCYQSTPRMPHNNVMNSYEREDTIEQSPFRIGNQFLKNLIEKVQEFITVQAMVFDGSGRSLELATGNCFAGSRAYRKYTSQDLFGKPVPTLNQTTWKMVRTLDWLLPMLGPYTDIVVTPKSAGKLATALVTWPGVIGSYSGMNEHGVIGALSVVPRPFSGRAQCPNALQFREILETCSGVDEIDQELEKRSFASPMNWVVSAPDGLRRYELYPQGETRKIPQRIGKGQERVGKPSES